MATEQETDLATRAAAYLKQPYARIVVPEPDGTYRGEVLEFPGCIATGDTPAETLESLEDVADAWLQSALAHNQPIPEPVDSTEFSGRLVLRMPKSLHKKAARSAERDGVSLNQLIITALAEYIGEHSRQQNLVFNASAGAGALLFEHAQQTGYVTRAPSGQWQSHGTSAVAGIGRLVQDYSPYRRVG